jgi:hypothetical protein
MGGGTPGEDAFSESSEHAGLEQGGIGRPQDSRLMSPSVPFYDRPPDTEIYEEVSRDVYFRWYSGAKTRGSARMQHSFGGSRHSLVQLQIAGIRCLTISLERTQRIHTENRRLHHLFRTRSSAVATCTHLQSDHLLRVHLWSKIC